MAFKALILSDMHFGFTSQTSAIWTKYWRRHLEPKEWDVIILAGDLGSARLRHWMVGARFLAGRCKGKPVLMIRGNHCIWDRSIRNLHYLIESQQAFAKDNGIHLLQDFGPWQNEHVLISGWDGWYKDPPHQRSNDFRQTTPEGKFLWYNIKMNILDKERTVDTDYWLNIRAHRGFEKTQDDIMDSLKPVKVVVTHMPILPGFRNPARNGDERFGEALLGHASAIVMGHSHQRVDTVVRGTRLLNPGPDYNRPNFILTEFPLCT
jgi:predicted phosphodiesterase